MSIESLSFFQYYHYTDYDGFMSIRNDKCIEISVDGRHGDGVYLTDLSPGNASNTSKKKIAASIYGGWSKSHVFYLVYQIKSIFLIKFGCQEH